MIQNIQTYFLENFVFIVVAYEQRLFVDKIVMYFTIFDKRFRIKN